MAAVARTRRRPTAAEAVIEVEDEGIGSQPIYVWEVPVRVTHWLIVISIIGAGRHGAVHPRAVPGPVQPGRGVARRWPTSGSGTRSSRSCSASRSPSGSTGGSSGNSFSSWRQIIPHRREQFYWMTEMARYYGGRRKHPVPYTGHNHLAGLAYTIVSVGLFTQVLTGLLLFGWIMQSGPFHVLFGWGNACRAGSRAVRIAPQPPDLPVHRVHDPPRLLAPS